MPEGQTKTDISLFAIIICWETEKSFIPDKKKQEKYLTLKIMMWKTYLQIFGPFCEKIDKEISSWNTCDNKMPKIIKSMKLKFLVWSVCNKLTVMATAQT